MGVTMQGKIVSYTTQSTTYACALTAGEIETLRDALQMYQGYYAAEWSDQQVKSLARLNVKLEKAIERVEAQEKK